MITLLSGMLECAESGGSYAIMAKERFGCTNQKTILRRNLEDRVPFCFPAAFSGMSQGRSGLLRSTICSTIVMSAEPALKRIGSRRRPRKIWGEDQKAEGGGRS